jgi:hypothetical protein
MKSLTSFIKDSFEERPLLIGLTSVYMWGMILAVIFIILPYVLLESLWVKIVNGFYILRVDFLSEKTLDERIDAYSKLSLEYRNHLKSLRWYRKYIYRIFYNKRLYNKMNFSKYPILIEEYECNTRT